MDPSSTGGSDDPLSTIVAIAACLILSFLFAGSETAITSMGEARVRRLIDEGKGPKRFLERWLTSPSAILTTLLAGNTLVNIIASALTTSLALRLAGSGLLPEWFSEYVVGAGVFMLTMFVLVLGEITPKTLAKSHPEWFLRPFRLVWWFHLGTRRVTSGLTWLARRLVRLLGVDTRHNGYIVSEEEVEDMVRIGAEEGSIEASRGEMLQNVFDLWEVTLRAIMTPRTQVRWLMLDATLENVLDTIAETGFSRYPVYDGSPDEVPGIFYAKNIIGYLEAADRAPFVLGEHLAPPMFVQERQKASHVLQEFKTRKMHMAIVVDEHGGTSGIVTLEDVLEELVGEIYDEYDHVERLFEPAGPNTWTVDASAEIRELEESLDFALPESETYSTIAGFVIDHAGRVPEVGYEFTSGQAQITVLEADDKRPLRVQIIWDPLTEGDDDGDKSAD